jgi:hypothetical protein
MQIILELPPRLITIFHLRLLGDLTENCNESSRLLKMIRRGHAVPQPVEYDVPLAGIPLSTSSHVIAKK